MTSIPAAAPTTTALKDRAILFSGPEIVTLLRSANPKTQTRRVCDYPSVWVPENLSDATMPDGTPGFWSLIWHDGYGEPYHAIDREFANIEQELLRLCRYGPAGRRLWVRETLELGEDNCWRYRADKSPVLVSKANETAMLVWAHHKEKDYCPPTHMPRWASRITLEVVSVRAERVQDISEMDCMAEGVREYIYRACGDHPDMVGYVTDADGEWDAAHKTPKQAFAVLWDSINGAKEGCSWESNPWCYAITFRRVEADAG